MSLRFSDELTLKIFKPRFFFLLFLFQAVVYAKIHAQQGQEVEKQLWTMVLLNYGLNEKWSYNQDFGYQHSYETPTFTRFLVRSQFNRQVTGAFSLHGGLILMYKFNEEDNNAYEIRPWMGTKLRWPHLWRFDFVHYLRFEQRFENTINVNDWENNFRVRYKIGSSVPLNHHSVIDNTLYAMISYEFYSESFGNDIRFTTAATHRYDLGMGYRQNMKNRYEALLVALNGRVEDTENYTLSSMALFLRYRRFINWD